MLISSSKATFDDVRNNGYIGIPTLVTDDGKLTLDWESFFTGQGIEVVHPGNEGAACGIDGKGC